MISRIWRGWTTPGNADTYEQLLREEIIPEIADEASEGYRDFKLLRQTVDDEVEFMTILQFDSWDAVRAFAGEDYEKAYIPDKARQVLKRFDGRAQHYEVREHREYK